MAMILTGYWWRYESWSPGGVCFFSRNCPNCRCCDCCCCCFCAIELVVFFPKWSVRLLLMGLVLLHDTVIARCGLAPGYEIFLLRISLLQFVPLSLRYEPKTIMRPGSETIAGSINTKSNNGEYLTNTRTAGWIRPYLSYYRSCWLGPSSDQARAWATTFQNPARVCLPLEIWCRTVHVVHPHWEKILGLMDAHRMINSLPFSEAWSDHLESQHII